jgi:hypothetical protein
MRLQSARIRPKSEFDELSGGQCERPDAFPGTVCFFLCKFFARCSTFWRSTLPYGTRLNIIAEPLLHWPFSTNLDNLTVQSARNSQTARATNRDVALAPSTSLVQRSLRASDAGL